MELSTELEWAEGKTLTIALKHSRWQEVLKTVSRSSVPPLLISCGQPFTYKDVSEAVLLDGEKYGTDEDKGLARAITAVHMARNPCGTL